MNANFSKRFSAFVIDILIVSVICNILVLIIPKSDNYDKLNDELNNVAQEYADKLTDDMDVNIYQDYIDEVAPISYQIEKETFIDKILIIVVYILYYVVYQFKNNGQTLGKKLMKIKVKAEGRSLQINDLLFRSFIVNSVLSSLISVILLFTTKNMNYRYASEVVSFIFGGALLISGMMCLIRKDKKTLQDCLTKTLVVEVE